MSEYCAIHNYATIVSIYLDLSAQIQMICQKVYKYLHAYLNFCNDWIQCDKLCNKKNTQDAFKINIRNQSEAMIRADSLLVFWVFSIWYWYFWYLVFRIGIFGIQYLELVFLVFSIWNSYFWYLVFGIGIFGIKYILGTCIFGI